MSTRRPRAPAAGAAAAPIAPDEAPAAAATPSLAHLLGRLAVVEDRVQRLVAHRRAGDPAPDDAFRGLYLADDHVGAVMATGPAARRLPAGTPAEGLAALEQEADAAEATGADLRLRRLQRALALDPAEVDVLLAALLPDLDPRYERLYGYLNDDVSRRRCSVELALHLAGLDPLDGTDRSRLLPAGRLARAGLLSVSDDRPFLGRELSVPDRVTAHLLGDDRPDGRLERVLARGAVGWGGDPVAAAVEAGLLPLHVRGLERGQARAAAVGGLASLGVEALVVDLARLAEQPDAAELAAVAHLEALLRGAVLVAGPVEALARAGEPRDALTSGVAALVLTGVERWDPAWSHDPPTEVLVREPDAAERRALWSEVLGGEVAGDPERLDALRLAPEAAVRSVVTAGRLATLEGGPVTVEHVLAGARAQNAAGLEALARRVEPGVSLDDMVVTDLVREQLDDLVGRARWRHLVLGEWSMRPGGGRGRGINALFAGDPGTGKTMAAEAVAAALGLDLYTVDLATVVDKYIGETEKNLERIFSEAEGVNGVLLFDEADALFGKRSDVSDAHDRHANIEVAYLLQRMESFDGLAVLATNLRANLDEAFARRLDVVVDFLVPDESQRRLLWDRCLGPRVPRAGDLDLDFCAKAFELSGGSIRAIAVTAAYRAAAHGRAVEMADLVAATNTEYRKLGRMVHEREFGAWAPAAVAGTSARSGSGGLPPSAP